MHAHGFRVWIGQSIGRGRERSTQGDRVVFSSMALWEGFLGEKSTQSPCLWGVYRLWIGCWSLWGTSYLGTLGPRVMVVEATVLGAAICLGIILCWWSGISCLRFHQMVCLVGST